MSSRLTPIANSSPSANASPRREPPRSPPPTQSPQNSRGLTSQVNNAGIHAYNSWYSMMNSEWAWIVYTVIIIILLIGGVYVYNMFMYPSASQSQTPSKINTPPINKIDPV